MSGICRRLCFLGIVLRSESCEQKVAQACSDYDSNPKVHLKRHNYQHEEVSQHYLHDVHYGLHQIMACAHVLSNNDRKFSIIVHSLFPPPPTLWWKSNRHEIQIHTSKSPSHLQPRRVFPQYVMSFPRLLSLASLPCVCISLVLKIFRPS